MTHRRTWSFGVGPREQKARVRLANKGKKLSLLKLQRRQEGTSLPLWVEIMMEVLASKITNKKQRIGKEEMNYHYLQMIRLCTQNIQSCTQRILRQISVKKNTTRSLVIKSIQKSQFYSTIYKSKQWKKLKIIFTITFVI